MDRKRILIVEDELIIALSNRSVVQKLGHEVAGVAVSGEEAVEKALALTPDLILMDITLAGSLSGVEAAIRIKEKLSVPVIFISSNTDNRTLRDARETAPYGFLMKPVSEQDMSVMISSVFEQPQQDRARTL
jgi:CheY-like chemotaxis protein